MTVVLILKNPPTILNVAVGQSTMNVNVPGLWQAYDVGDGWESPDGKYAVVAPVPFQMPDGKVALGAPRYEIDDQGVVSEICDVQDAPPPPPVTIASLDFIGLFTEQEALAITTAGQSDAQIALWLTMSSAAQNVVMSDPRTIQGLNYLVSKNLITPERMAQIVAGEKPAGGSIDQS